MKKSARKTKILVLYANYGAGHKRAAQAVEEAICKQMPDADIAVEDFLGNAFPLIDWFMRKIYLQTFSWAKSIYGFLYYKTKELPADALLFQALSYLGSWKLERYLQRHQPTLVISTFPTLTGMLAKVKSSGKADFQLWCVLTDYVTHSQWLYQAVDHYFVPTDEIKSEIADLGIDPSSVTITGIPVMSSFCKPHNRNMLLEKWELADDRPIVLISAGAFGVTNLADVCKRLVQEDPHFQLIVVCGRNRKLYHQMKSIEQSGQTHLLALPFVKEMDELLQIADLFITKAGGLSTSEAVASKVPMVLYQSLPGQELENSKYLEKLGVATRVDTEDELVKAVSRLLGDPGLLRSMEERLAALPLVRLSAGTIASKALAAVTAQYNGNSKKSYSNQQLVNGDILSNA